MNCIPIQEKMPKAASKSIPSVSHMLVHICRLYINQQFVSWGEPVFDFDTIVQEIRGIILYSPITLKIFVYIYIKQFLLKQEVGVWGTYELFSIVFLDFLTFMGIMYF